MNNKEYEKYAEATIIFAFIILITNLAFYFYPLAYKMGLRHEIIWTVFETLRSGNVFRSPYPTKFTCFAVFALGNLIRTGMPTERKLKNILIEIAVGALVFFLPVRNIILYMFTTLTGFIILADGTAQLARYFHLGLEKNNDLDTFEQMTTKIENKYSFNIPMRFHWKGKWHKGWINVVNPFRMTLVQGAPGSGKSFSVFEPAFFQLIKKGYASAIYDFKAPQQTEVAYNLYRLYGKKINPNMEFHVINFDNPMYSERCNPIDPKFLNDPADATEVSEIVMENVNKGSQGGQKFFDDSAKLYLDAIVWFLRKYKDGKYCTFPHAIELMAVSYKKTLKIMKDYPELEVKLKPFEDAMVNKALEQLSGQIASAQIPLNKFVSPSLYYVLSANEFDLDINNPQHPKIVCLGNNPDRQAIYGATTALLVSRIIKVINHKDKAPMFFSLDELPTIFLKGLDNLAASARSNKVALIAGVQTKAQLERDYKKEEAQVIEQNIGNFFIGATTGSAAEAASKMFGKQKIVNRNISSGDSDSISLSYKEEDRLSVDRIETLHQGTFCGKVADDFKQKIDLPLFCGEIQRDPKELEEMKNFKPLPFIKDFGREEITKQVNDYPYDALAKALRPKAIEKYHENGGVVIIPERIDTILKELVMNVEEEEKKKILAAEIERRVKERMDETVMQEYQKIRNDIQQLVDLEYTRIIEEENAAKQMEEKAQLNNTINGIEQEN